MKFNYLLKTTLPILEAINPFHHIDGKPATSRRDHIHRLPRRNSYSSPKLSSASACNSTLPHVWLLRSLQPRSVEKPLRTRRYSVLQVPSGLYPLHGTPNLLLSSTWRYTRLRRISRLEISRSEPPSSGVPPTAAAELGE